VVATASGYRLLEGEQIPTRPVTICRSGPIIDENFVAKFAALVRASGGFAIW